MSLQSKNLEAASDRVDGNSVHSGFSVWRETMEDREGQAVRVFFIPTMGALHEGHAALIRHARDRVMAMNGTPVQVVVSVFVNPTQFNDMRDFDGYPITPDADVELARAAGADSVVMPAVDEIYPSGVPATVDRVDYGSLTGTMEGAHRPGHFDGVVHVVRRLFQLVRPDVAFFGEKDWQQLAVISRLAVEEFPDLEIAPVATVREADGLAMSSRNVRLDAEHRALAVHLSRELERVARSGQPHEEAKRAMERLVSMGFEMEYLNIADGFTLEAAPWKAGEMRVFAAGSLGGVRLIDNMPFIGPAVP